jgi:hypothetical protein
MTGISEVVEQAARLEPDVRLRVGALLLVRYCSFYGDSKFSPWFEQEQQALERVAEIAALITQGMVADVDLAGIRRQLDRALEESDPDGPPFQTEIIDHLVFATEVFDFLQAPQDVSALASALERADELAEAHSEMSQGVGDIRQSADLSTLEDEARGLDVLPAEEPSASLARSQRFGHAYAMVIDSYYSNEDAGIRDH